MSITINPPPGPWTVADLDTLPNIDYRFEIHEGNLVMMSPVKRWHSRIARRLANLLESRGDQVDTEIGVMRSPRDTRTPDVAVFHPQVTDLSRSFYRPEELLVVIEIVSDSSQHDDRLVKPLWYAEAGIPEFWRVEQGDDDEAVIYQYKLARTADGIAAYVEAGVTTLETLEAKR